MYLVDASIWVHVFRRQRQVKTPIQELLKPIVLSGDAAITEWTILEIMVGIRAAETVESVLRKLGHLPRLELPMDKWPRTWDLAADLRKKSFTPSAADCLISTVAIGHDVPLLHCDKDFEQIAKRSDLKTIDWTKYLQS